MGHRSARDGIQPAFPRWSPGERMHDVLDESITAAPGRTEAIAVEAREGSFTFGDLERWSDALAADLADEIGPGDRVALLFDRGPRAWAAVLALSKLGAAWVPLDPVFPAERIALIAEDASVRLGLVDPGLSGRLTEAGVRAHPVPAYDAERLVEPFPARPTAEDVAYIVYTSGTTGRPKGVPIGHAAICSFLRTAADLYGYGPSDRVYQGLTIAFDFSIEEIWVPLVAGATLVPAPEGVALVGEELTAFLRRRRITALCCVPTLLASIEAELPALRLLLVSGESCPQQLVQRWAVGGRRMINLYGPTETTVSATWALLAPDEPVTIGRPLPGYRTSVVAPGGIDPVPIGEPGELVIAGPGVAAGYLGRPDLTARAFIPEPGSDDGGAAYRTGDLVRLDEAGRLVHLGRIDGQVKVRGYRIELEEIESVLLAQPGVAQAAVALVRVTGRPDALAGYWVARTGAAPVSADLVAALRRALPAYMVPSTLDRIDVMPMLPSHKVDRAALPAPARPSGTGGRRTSSDPHEAAIAGAVAAVLDLDDVDPAADLFADLGADSFSVARLCAALRKETVPAITTRLVYANPTVRALAAATGPHTAAARVGSGPARVLRPPHRASRRDWGLTGLVQAVVLAGALAATAAGIDLADSLLTAATGPGVYATAVAITAAITMLCAGLPIAAKWLLIGRWTEQEIPAWSARYLRFWIVRTSLRLSPVRLLAGSPLYTLYLRALGVRIGRHALVLTTHVPVCADLIRIGEDAVVAPSVKLDGYRVRDGRVETGRVVIGDGAVVGHGSHLDIGTAIGDRATLAHASALLEGQRVPDGRGWHGSPAIDAGSAPAATSGPRIGTAARVRYALLQLVVLLGVTGPLTIGVAVWADDIDVFDPLQAAWFAALLLVVGWSVRACGPRLLARSLEPGREYALYTGRWAGLRAATRIANSPLLNELFGDSSAIVWYLRSVGVRFRSVHQTGSNLGTAQHFDLPSWCTIGGGTLISDGLAMPNAQFSPHSFRVQPISVGDRVFMGNGVVYPPGAGVGDDVLLATKVMVPVDGLVRSGVGLLGSPAFEVPRTVRRDAAFASLTGRDRERDLAGKNRHNAVTGALFLLHRFFAGYLAIAVVGLTDISTTPQLFLALLGAAAAEIGLLVATDLACRGFRRLRPITCSLYDPRFWRHERYWKLSDPRALGVLDGTPFKALAWRLLGVRVGAMLLDDGASMPERSMVTLGDHVTLGSGSTLHGHSLEDGVFKSGSIIVGDGSSIGPSALVHYGVEIGAGARIAPDAFLLKGEVVRDGEEWVGNPAHPALLS